MKFPIPEDKFKEISALLETVFQKDELASLGRSSGFVQRERIVNGYYFAQLCIIGAQECGLNSSLTQLLAQAWKLGMAMSAEGLNLRFNAKAETMMEKLLSKIVTLQLEQDIKLDTLSGFSEVLVEDSSNWQLPACLQMRFKGCGGGASAAGIKLNVRLDLKGTDMQLNFRQGTDPDSTAGLGWIPPQSLLLRDLGYFKIDDFRTIEKCEAFYVSRFKFSTNIYLSNDPEAKQVDLLELINKMKVNQAEQLWCYVGRTERFRTRLVLQKVPPEVANAKRKKMKEDKQNKRKNLSEDRLKFCELNAFITNLPESMYLPESVMNLYSIRWMIEIIFKVWKSVYRIDKMHSMNEHRFMCMLYGKLIWILLHHKLFSWMKRHFWNTYHMDVSELKGFKILQELKTDLHHALWNNSYHDCFEFLSLLYRLFSKTARKQVRRRNFNQLLIYPTPDTTKPIVNQPFGQIFSLT
jgi:hypothetical protein